MDRQRSSILLNPLSKVGMNRWTSMSRVVSAPADTLGLSGIGISSDGRVKAIVQVAGAVGQSSWNSIVPAH